MGFARSIAVLAVATAGSATACPPPIPGQTDAEYLRPIFDRTTDIVYGVVTRGARDDELAQFRVIHVYRGSLSPGTVIRAAPSYGVDPPACVAFPYPPRALAGQYGVVAFRSDRPHLNFVSDHDLQIMFREGWIVSARR
ncbi:MAG TPA: hypothetical protein VF704_03975 [Allosphingosinicella sp.]|jgi:hypothetical protein